MAEPTAEQLAAVEKQGLVVRDLKSSGGSKADIDAAVAELLRLKEAAGIKPPAKKEKKKKEKGAPKVRFLRFTLIVFHATFHAIFTLVHLSNPPFKLAHMVLDDR